MNPEQPGQNPYDFIMNPNAPKKPAILGNNGSSKNFIMKIALIVVGLIVAIILIVVAMSLFKGGGLDKTALIGVAQSQQEIITISSSSTKLRSQALLNSAATTKATLDSQQKVYTAYLLENRIKTNQKLLAGKINPTTTSQLEDAGNTGNYDTVYKQVMQEKLEAYAKELTTVYGKASGQNLRKILSEDFEQTQMLIKQLNVTDVTADTPAVTQ